MRQACENRTAYSSDELQPAFSSGKQRQVSATSCAEPQPTDLVDLGATCPHIAKHIRAGCNDKQAAPYKAHGKFDYCTSPAFVPWWAVIHFELQAVNAA